MITFPTIPHLRGSCGTFDDTFMDTSTTVRILNTCVLVQEKLDGINIGISLDQRNSFQLIKKNRLINWQDCGYLTVFRQWCDDNHEKLFGVLSRGLTLFGEFLVNLERRNYSETTWILFDAFDYRNGRFLAQSELRKQTYELNLSYAPDLFFGVPKTLTRIEQLIGISSLTGHQMEGVCLRIEEGKFLRERFKFVRRDYIKKEW